MDIPLGENNRVCIVGGGPAGSFAALHLLSQARLRGLDLEVLIFEPRDFTKPGPSGCNRCAGILSSRLIRGLDQIGLTLPSETIQAELNAYTIHLDGSVLSIDKPDPRRRIVSVYRGGGPRLAADTKIAGFDRFLLEQACAQGARHIPARVRKISWEGHPVVYTARKSYPAHLLVIATGVNSRAPLSTEFRYQPPPTEVMAQDEILLPPSWPPDQVGIFFKDPPGLVFGALIPKGRFLNISLLGRGMTIDSISSFIETQDLDTSLISADYSLCGCNPRIAVGPARNYYGQRWVSVGDAAVTRLYKDGIGSAFYTTQLAMQTAVNQGVSNAAFQNGYAPYCRRIAIDNFYGRLLFRLWAVNMRNPRLLRVWKNAVVCEADLPPDQRVHIRILWGMFTGDEPYRDLFYLTMSPQSLRGLWAGFRSSRFAHSNKR